MVELVFGCGGFALGVAATLFMQTFITAWRLSYLVPKEPPVDIVDAENVIRIEKWKERRSETDKTFGRWA
jgi:hypothetical protein